MAFRLVADSQLMPPSSFPGQQSPRISRQQLYPIAVERAATFKFPPTGGSLLPVDNVLFQNEINESRHTSATRQK
jgi:hypothetical protein